MPTPENRQNEGDRRDRLIALNTAEKLGRSTICRLAATASIWADRGERSNRLAAELGLPPDSIGKAVAVVARAGEIAADERNAAALHGARVITWLDDAYPETLRCLTLPPPVLYCRGQLDAAPAVAVVGSRRAQPYGIEAARFFAGHLAAARVTVVSGLAVGVDGAAHRGALEVPGGRTVAVLGCGVDVVYPRRHRSLRRQIAASGALLSEFPVGTPPRPQHFPIRNRIIAALGACTLVIEAAPRSGSLITARYALELNREIFALPGRIFDENGLGANALLRDGARLALHPDDVLAEIGVEPTASAMAGTADATPPLGPFATRLWEAMTPGSPLSAEALAGQLDAPLSEVLSQLLELELGGWIERFPGPVYGRRGAWR